MHRSVSCREAGDDEKVGVGSTRHCRAPWGREKVRANTTESSRDRERMHLFTLARPSSRQNKDQKLCGQGSSKRAGGRRA